MQIYKCQHCKYSVVVGSNIGNSTKQAKISAKQKMGKHYEEEHKDLLPTDMDGYRWFYYQLTKKDRGSCVICHHETDFNRNSMKYSRFCSNPQCKQKYKQERDKRMMDKYGKIHLLDDPEFQKKMQAGRKIAGVYTWSDRSAQFGYLSSYELDFLRFLDLELHWPSSDLFAPSPHTYVYEYKGEKHYYMPDFFIPSLSLEIEIKDDGSALNISRESREKDVIKDATMKSLSNVVNYIKIVNKQYDEFMTLLKEA